MRLSKDLIAQCIDLPNPTPILKVAFPDHPDVLLMSSLIKFAKLVKTECDCIATFFSLEKGYVKATFVGPDNTGYELKLSTEFRCSKKE